MANFVLSSAAQLQKSHDFNSAILHRFNSARNIYIEKQRSVRADNTFPLDSVRYEAPADLHSRKVQVRFNRHDSGNSPVIVYYNGHRIGAARPVDFIANDRRPNQ